MKIAVIGAGSTYTPELVSGLSRERDRIDVTELALHDIDAERLDVVGGLAKRMLDRAGLRRAGSSSPATSTARSTAPTSCSSRSASAARRRASPTRRCRSRAAASGRRRRVPAGSRRRCARCRSCWASPSGSRELAADDAWIVDFTNPVGIVTRSLLDAGHRAVGLCNVAIGYQRWFAGLYDVAPARRDHRPGRPESPDVDPRRADRGRGRAAGAPRRARRRDRRRGATAARSSSIELGAIPSYYLHYFYAHDAVLAEQLVGSRGRRASPRSSATCSRCTATRR